MRLTVYQVREDMSDIDNYVGSIAILNHCMIPFDVVVNARETLIRSRGRVNPSGGFMIDVPKQLQPKLPITNCLELARWINEYGFIPV